MTDDPVAYSVHTLVAKAATKFNAAFHFVQVSWTRFRSRFFFSRRMNRIRSYNRRHLEVSNTGTTRICIIVTFFPSFRCGTQLMQRIRCTYDIISIYHTKCQMKKPVWGIRLKDKTYFRLFSLVVFMASRGSHACLFVRGVVFFLFLCFPVISFFLINSVHSRCRRPDFLCNSIVRFSVERKKESFCRGQRTRVHSFIAHEHTHTSSS